LNLREVSSATKRWVDSLHPAQAKRIFFRIPIYFILTVDKVKRFHICPPPPPAMSMKLHIPFPEVVVLEETITPSLKTSYPTFFSFWTTQLHSLSTENYSLELLQLLGSPKSLRNLQCDHITENETHPSLLQLERIYFRACFGSENSLFRHLTHNRILNRVSTDIYFGDIVNNPFEGLQLLIDANRSNTNFQLEVQFHTRESRCRCLKDEHLKSFMSSVADSASSIRLFPVDNKIIEQILEIHNYHQSKSKSRYQVIEECFKCAQVVHLKDASEKYGGPFGSFGRCLASVPAAEADARGIGLVHIGQRPL